MSDALCELFAEWQECTGCDSSGYDTGDCVSLCSNGQQYVAKSLIDDNTDEPWEGFVASPRSWEVRSMCYWISYIGVDCDGADIYQGDRIATCKNLSDLRNELIGLIAQKQDQLLNCAGTALPGGARVASCAELDGVEAKADNAIALAGSKQAQLLDCNGAQMAGGSRVPTCDQLPAPYSLNDCEGAVIPKDTQVLTCAGFPTAFEDMLENSCLTLQDLGSQCGDIAQVTAIDCGGGKYRLGIISAASSEYGTGGFDHHLTTPGVEELWPADPNDTASVMTYQAAENKLTAVGGVFANLDQADQDQLNDYRLFCATHDAACDETIELFVGATVSATDANLTKSQFIFIVNGEAQVTGAGLQGFASFNNKQENFEDTVNIPVNAGPNTICVYLVRPDTGKLLTQFNVRNSNNVQRPRWRISKAGV